MVTAVLGVSCMIEGTRQPSPRNAATILSIAASPICMVAQTGGDLRLSATEEISPGANESTRPGCP